MSLRNKRSARLAAANPMPNEKPAWEMTAEEFADSPPSYEWFKWFGWVEGHHYCYRDRQYALLTGYPGVIKTAMQEGHIKG